MLGAADFVRRERLLICVWLNSEELHAADAATLRPVTFTVFYVTTVFPIQGLPRTDTQPYSSSNPLHLPPFDAIVVDGHRQTWRTMQRKGQDLRVHKIVTSQKMLYKHRLLWRFNRETDCVHRTVSSRCALSCRCITVHKHMNYCRLRPWLFNILPILLLLLQHFILFCNSSEPVWMNGVDIGYP